MNRFGVSEEHWEWFLQVHNKHMLAFWEDGKNRNKYALANVLNVEYDLEEDTMNVYYSDIWWHYTRDGHWY